MKHRYARSLTCLGLVALTGILALPAQAQDIAQRLDSPDARPARSAQASTAAYTPEPSHMNAASAPAEGKRKPRWFDERRQQQESSAPSGHFERLSYTRYEGEAEPDSGTCVYYQSSYTYSCR